MNKKEVLWKKMDDLIAIPNISNTEKDLFIQAKTDLKNGKTDEFVASGLKSKLSLLSMKKQLSPDVVPFFTELSRLYLGYGSRDNITLGPMF